MKYIKIVIGTITVAAVLQAAPALAYLEPDAVFGGAGLTLAPQPPPTAREGADVIAKQQQSSALHRAAAQSSLQSTDDEPQDIYIPPNVDTSRHLLDPSGEAAYDLRQQRLSNQKGAAPTIIISGNGDVIDANGNVLHSGAPRMSVTGPEDVIFFALASALLGMIGYLWRRPRSVESLLLR